MEENKKLSYLRTFRRIAERDIEKLTSDLEHHHDWWYHASIKNTVMTSPHDRYLNNLETEYHEAKCEECKVGLEETLPIITLLDELIKLEEENNEHK